MVGQKFFARCQKDGEFLGADMGRGFAFNGHGSMIKLIRQHPDPALKATMQVTPWRTEIR